MNSSSGQLSRTDSSTPHYQAFPNARPPPTKGRPPNLDRQNTSSTFNRSHSHDSQSSNHHSSPLPTRQLAVLAVIALAEQTALNSISPYLPDMASHFPEVAPGQVGLFVGMIASAFALAQFATNFFWGWLSDKAGRKPVILLGTILTAACFVAFGFCKTLWQAIAVQALMGLVNGNQGVVSTCLGEITDKSNQSKAFKYLPVVYGIGGVTGPLVGGLMVKNTAVQISAGEGPKYPYLPPNLFSAAVLVVDFVIASIFLEESLDEAKDLPPLQKRVTSLFSWIWQFSGASHRPTYARHRPSADEEGRPLFSDDQDDSDAESLVSLPTLIPENTSGLKMKDILNRDTVLVLATFLIFQLANIAYNSLYPIFAEAKPPTGRDLLPSEIGISLAFAGFVTVIFQLGFFNMLKEKIGNKATYRAGLAGFVIAFALMPFVGYKDPNDDKAKIWLWVELGAILIIKTVASVGGLTSALLLVSQSSRYCSQLLMNSDYQLGA